MYKYNPRIRNIDLNLERKEDFEKIVSLCSALGSEVRLRILEYMQNPPYVKELPEIGSELHIPKSTLVHHLEILENAGLIQIFFKSSAHGAVRLVARNMQSASIRFYYNKADARQNEKSALQTLGVGQYADYEGDLLCFATNTEHHFFIDSNFTQERFSAQLIYTSDGVVTYHFSNAVAKKEEVSEVVFSFEICSEAPYFDNTYQSDITFWINGVETATYTSAGDFGDRRGHLNPNWWPSVNTQYGQLVNLSIRENGVYINGKRTGSCVTLSDLKLAKGNKTTFALGNKVTAEHKGGFNLFGRNFGDYPQDICMRTVYKP